MLKSDSWRWHMADFQNTRDAHINDMGTLGRDSLDAFRRHWRTFLPVWLFPLCLLLAMGIVYHGPPKAIALRLWLGLFLVVNVVPMIRYMRSEISRREMAFLGGFVPFLIWIIGVMVLLGVAWLRR